MKSTKKKPATKKPATKKPATKKPAAKAKRTAKRLAVAKKAKRASARPASASKGLGETLLRALTLAMVSDGEVAPAEEAILRRFAREPIFKGVDATAVIAGTIKRCLRDGPDVMFEEIASALATKQDRETAFVSCLAVTTVDGRLTPSEVRMLHALRDAFAISSARARTLAGPLAAIFD